MRTTLIFAISGPATPTAQWPDEFVRNEPPAPAGTVDPLDMRAAGCALMRSTVAGAEAVLTFEWSADAGGAPDARDAFVAWWAAQPGWKFEITSVDDLPNVGAAATGELLYGPDVNGRPCSPPPAGTLDGATPDLEAVNGRPCSPPLAGTVPAPAARPVEGSAEDTG